MKIALRPADSEEEWARLVASHPATPYHQWGFLTWVAPLLEARFVPLVVERDGLAVGVAPVLLQRVGPLATANVVPVQYVGPLVEAADLLATARELRRWGLRHRVAYLRVALTPGPGAAAGSLTGSGFAERVDETYLIDLERPDLDAVFATVGSPVRNAYRRSVRNGVTVRPAQPAEIRDLLPRVHEQAVGKPTPYVHRVATSLAEQPPPFPVRCVSAVLDGQAIGVTVSLRDDAGAISWLGSVLREHQSTEATTAMAWDYIGWAYGEGCRTLDMLGAPSPGIGVYKRKFKPVVRPHLVASWQLPGVGLARRLAD